MSSRRLALTAGALLLATTVLAGCAAEGSTSKSTEAAAAAKPSPSASATPAEVKASPLGEFLNGDFDSTEDFTKREEAIATCMTEQGFEYTVTTMNLPTQTNIGANLARAISPPREQVAEHGLGFAELKIPETVPQPDVDANTKYVDTLSAAQKDAYYRALNGKGVDTDVSTLTWEDKGCTGKAMHDLGGSREGTRPAILDDVYAFRKAEMTDPKAVALEAEWAACMAKAGYPDETQRTHIGDGLLTEFGTYAMEHPQATRDDPKFAEFLKKDIALGLADWDCTDAMDYGPKIRKIQDDLENQFIKDHKGELEEAKIWLWG